MRPHIPDSDDLDEEIRGHLAISIKQRIERGEDPAPARLAALKEFGNVTLTRDSMRGIWRPRWLDAAEPADGEENPQARLRIAGPRFFAVVGIPMLAGRDFADDDRGGSEPVSIVSQSVAPRLFPNGDAVNRHMWWTDPYFGKPIPAASSAWLRTSMTRT